jgi:hypothetical protein
LTDVACRVFGGMKQEAKHGSRQTGTADSALLEERVA